MSPIDPNEPSPGSESRHLCLFALVASIATTSIAVLYPSGPPTIGTLISFAWIWSQATMLLLPGLILGMLISRRRPKLGRAVGGLFILVIPLLVLCDAITFSWIGERFLSESIWRLVTSLRQSLTNHISAGTFSFAASTATTFAACALAAWWTTGLLARRLNFRPAVFLAVMSAFAIASSIPAIWQPRQTRLQMANCSARHPFCAAGLVGYRGVGKQVSASAPQGGGFAATMRKLVTQRQQQYLALTAQATTDSHPDVVIVVIESFRPELIDPQVMPTLWEYSQRGMHLRNHFSAGNATTHGMFALLNGLEAVWYSEAMKSAPLLNRLLRSAGYEIGFFAGHNDWKKFQMDDFISREQFDVFETDTPAWLESDRRATQRAVNFLQRDGVDAATARKPRLAILYLYSTHADYRSYPQDRIFKPAADDRFVIPYTADMAPEVWNRYKNSARSVDRFLSAVLDDDRVAIITGDHGESFLEDGVCGHGVRVSRYQNMTPAVIYKPGEFQKSILEPTMHADLLPTLLSAIGLKISDPSVLDGIDLFDQPHRELGRRLFVTRNYLSDDCALIGRELSESCFGYRCAIALNEFKAVPLNPIDDAGLESDVPVDGDKLLKQWLVQRFPASRLTPDVTPSGIIRGTDTRGPSAAER